MTDQRPRILAIDDTPANLLALEAVLTTDFDVQTATSGAMGLALAAKFLPDLILLDVMMPEMDGYETCRRIKASPRLKSIPVIFVTALSESQAESTGLTLGAADYITKPINVGIATQRIHNLLERERLYKKVEAHRQRLEETVVERTAQLRDMAIALAMAEERERYAIAQDLHDDLGQTLAIAKLKLSSLETPGSSEGEADLRQRVKEVEAMIDQANRSVRSLSLQLSPPVLSQFGLVPALEWLAEEMHRAWGLNVCICDDGKPKLLDELLSSSLFRTVRELLINVSKHAKTDTAEVSVLSDGDKLVVTVADDGIGLDVARSLIPSVEGGYGLFSVRERIKSIGGDMQIDSRPGDGTVVVLTLWLDAMRRRAPQ